MSELVLLHHNEPMTTSLAIADGTENTHESVIKLVRKYVEDLQTFGRVGFEIQPFETNGGIQSRELAYLNEPQATLLITYLRNSEIVRRFKIALVKAFFELRDRAKAIPPAFTTNNLSHGADLAVASDRTFRGFLRSARSSGMRLPQALQVANRQTIARTGMDMLSELGIEIPPEQIAGARQEDSADRFLHAWQQGRTRFPYTAAKCLNVLIAYRLWCAENNERLCDDHSFQLRYSKWPNLRKEQVRLSNKGGKEERHRMLIPDGFNFGDTGMREIVSSARRFSESLGIYPNKEA